MTKNPLVSIIIINYRDTKKLIPLCLRWLEDSNLKVEVEVIVWENGSNDDSASYLKQRVPQIKLYSSEKNLGFGQACNQAASKARGKYLLFLNPDILVLPGSIDQLVDFLELKPQVKAVAPDLLSVAGQRQYNARNFASWLTFFYRRTFLKKIPYWKKRENMFLRLDDSQSVATPVPWVLGACLLISKAVFKEVQGFDPRYFMYCEDMDLCRVLWSKNYQVWQLPQVKMYHFYQRDSAKKIFSLTWRYHLKSYLHYMFKWRGVPLNNFIR